MPRQITRQPARRLEDMPEHADILRCLESCSTAEGFNRVQDPAKRAATLGETTNKLKAISPALTRDSPLLGDLTEFAEAQLEPDRGDESAKDQIRLANLATIVLLERIGTKEAGVALTKVMEETAAYSSQTRGASLEAANSIQRGMMEDGRLPESTALGIKILTSLAVAEKRGRL